MAKNISSSELGISSNVSAVPTAQESTTYYGKLIGNASTADALHRPFNLSLQGDVTGSCSIAGDANVIMQTRTDHTLESDHAIHADDALYANRASHADLANIAALALKSNSANIATRATTAETAELAEEANHAQSASVADKAYKDGRARDISSTYLTKEEYKSDSIANATAWESTKSYPVNSLVYYGNAFYVALDFIRAGEATPNVHSSWQFVHLASDIFLNHLLIEPSEMTSLDYGKLYSVPTATSSDFFVMHYLDVEPTRMENLWAKRLYTTDAKYTN